MADVTREQVQDLVSARNAELRGEMTTGFAGVNGRLDGMGHRLDGMEQRLDGIEAILNEIRGDMKADRQTVRAAIDESRKTMQGIDVGYRDYFNDKSEDLRKSQRTNTFMIILPILGATAVIVASLLPNVLDIRAGTPPTSATAPVAHPTGAGPTTPTEP